MSNTCFSRNALLAMTSRAGSDFSGFMSMVALVSYIYFSTNNPLLVGLFLGLRIAGGILGSIWTSFIFARLSGKLTLCYVNILRLISVISLIHTPADTVVISVVGILLGFGNTIFAAGFNSYLPYWVNERYLPQINGYMSIISGLSMILGSLASGIIISLGGFNTAFIVISVGYLVSGIFICKVKGFDTVGEVISRPHYSVRNQIGRLADMLMYTPVLRLMLVVALTDAFGSASHNVGFPILSKMINPSSAPAVMAYMLSLLAAGQIIGAKVCSYYLKRQTNKFAEGIYFGAIPKSSVWQVEKKRCV